jgi:hypothetical protein
MNNKVVVEVLERVFGDTDNVSFQSNDNFCLEIMNDQKQVIVCDFVVDDNVDIQFNSALNIPMNHRKIIATEVTKLYLVIEQDKNKLCQNCEEFFKNYSVEIKKSVAQLLYGKAEVLGTLKSFDSTVKLRVKIKPLLPIETEQWKQNDTYKQLQTSGEQALQRLKAFPNGG